MPELKNDAHDDMNKHKHWIGLHDMITHVTLLYIIYIAIALICLENLKIVFSCGTEGVCIIYKYLNSLVLAKHENIWITLAYVRLQVIF